MMDHVASPSSPGRRAASYWFIDGLPEILLALTLGIVAIVGLLWRLYAPAPARGIYFLIVVTGFLLYLLAERRILDFLKSHLTYPRTGYVQPPEEKEGGLAGLVTLSLDSDARTLRANQNVTWFRQRTVILLYWLVFYLPALSDNTFGRWLVPCTMPVVAILLYVVGRKSERPYSRWSALILALTGLPFVWIGIPMFLQPLLALMLAAGWLAGVGLFTLVGYLRANPYVRNPRGMQA
jgi:hypothetical protein